MKQRKFDELIRENQRKAVREMSADCNRAPCGAGGEVFRILEILCPLGSSLADGGHKFREK
jgi:hypothetical protein